MLSRAEVGRASLDTHANICSHDAQTLEAGGASSTKALERGDLRHAVALAEELRLRARPPIELATRGALPAADRRGRAPGEYDAYALRWLGRWVTETGTATIEQAAEIAASLADLPVEPKMLEAITAAL